jgi:hypothetical protein
MPDGTLRDNNIDINSDATIQIGCKVFEINKAEPIVLSFN